MISQRRAGDEIKAVSATANRVYLTIGGSKASAALYRIFSITY